MDEDGFRKYRTVYIEVPKKNGKTEFAAGFVLYGLYADGEPGAEVYSAAADKEQASIVYRAAEQMVRNNRTLRRLGKLRESTKRIIVQSTNSFYRVLSADAFTKHGYNVSGLVIDELHAQPNRELFDVLTKGSGDARRQPLFVFITTAGTDRNSICWEQHEKARQILNGTREDPTYYPVIYGLEDDEDWEDEANWYKCNPSLDEIISIKRLRESYNDAKENPAEENIFRQLRLNQWVTSSVRWMQLRNWDKCNFELGDLKNRVCYAGLDLSSTQDLTACVLAFPSEYGVYAIMPFFWIPEDTMRVKERKDKVPYSKWVSQGYLESTPGNVVDYGYIRQKLSELRKSYDIRQIAYDRWNATEIVTNLKDDGFTMLPFGQGFGSMSAPTKDLMRLVLEKKIAHGGHPVLRWNADNIVVRTDPAGNIKPDKAKSTQRIDGMVGAIMGLDRALRNSSVSIYEKEGRGLDVI